MQQLHGRGGVVVDGADDDDDEPGLMVAAVRLPTAPAPLSRSARVRECE